MNGDFGGAGGTGVRIATASVYTGFAMTHYKECGKAGRRGRRPLRKRILWCVGEGLCPSRGRPQGSPLRKRNKRRDERATARVAPTKAQQEVQWAGDRKGRPYESATRGVMGGRPQGSPLRKRYKRRDERATARVAPTEGLQGVRCGEQSPVPSSLQNNFFFVAPIHATNVFFRS